MTVRETLDRLLDEQATAGQQHVAIYLGVWARASLTASLTTQPAVASGRLTGYRGYPIHTVAAPEAIFVASMGEPS